MLTIFRILLLLHYSEFAISFLQSCRENVADNELVPPLESSKSLLSEEEEVESSQERYMSSFLPSPTHEEKLNNEDLTPVFVTTLLEEGNISHARSLSKTKLGNVTSYTGFFTVNNICGNHLFFWFFLSSERVWEEAPVLLWLNGGPGASSLFGLFEEIGPWKFGNEGIETNKHSWIKNHNVLFVDQPVGTGFSFTERGCYAKNITVVAEEMYTALVQFFTMFPELQKNKFFMAGESHAGHYIPATAVEVDKRNPTAAVKINLKGIMVGNPLIDFRCLQTPNFLYELGIIDNRQRTKLLESLQNFDLAVQDGNSFKALEHYMEVLAVDVIINTGIPSIYNVISETDIKDNVTIFVTHEAIRKQIHVGNTSYSLISREVMNHLWEDRYTSQAPDIEYLLETGNYTVGFYTGQLDGRCPYSSLPCVLEKLQWSGVQEYIDAPRKPWFVSGRLAGWYKTAGNLYEVVVRNAGHMVPADQGEAILNLVEAVVSDTPGSPLLKDLCCFMVIRNITEISKLFNNTKGGE